MALGKLRSVVSGWPTWVELLIVAVGVFGFSILGSTLYLSGRVAGAPITESHLRSLLIQEPVILLLVGGFLYFRGWTVKRLSLRPRSTEGLIGAGLGIGAYAAYIILWTLATAAHLQPAYLHGATTVISGHVGLITVIAVCILNAVFEEIFVCGYVITVAKERGHLTLGVNVSIAIRLAYHLYQGSAGVVGIVPFGLIMAVWYSRTNRLWPVVIAHALTDFAGLIGSVY